MFVLLAAAAASASVVALLGASSMVDTDAFRR